MRVAMIAVGSRGDVQPFVALARGFRRAGHDVHIATQPEWIPMLEPLGIKVATVPMDLKALLETGAGRDMMARGTNPVAFVRALAGVAAPIAESAADALQAVCRDADALIGGQIGLIIGDAWLARLRLPHMHAALQPFTATREFGSPMIPELPAWIPARAALNRLSHPAFLAMVRTALTPLLLRAVPRRPRPRRAVSPRGPRPVAYGYSSAVVPRPADWPSHAQVTGYWFLEAPSDWYPPASLTDFLQSGDTPVYVGFGSMKSHDAARVTDVVLAALRSTAQRGVLFAGHGGLERRANSDQVHYVDAIPHDWLFPRMRAMVIHGGAGTTSAALRAGRPVTIVPYLGDQPFWGSRVAGLGVGPEPIVRGAFSAPTLAAAIERMVSDRGMQRRADRLGERLRAEDGVARAVAIAEAYFGGDARRM